MVLFLKNMVIIIIFYHYFLQPANGDICRYLVLCLNRYLIERPFFKKYSAFY